MKKLIHSILFLSIFASCSKTNISENFVPECIEERIQLFKTHSCSSPLITVKEYTFNDQIVYVFDRTDCSENFLPEILNAECKRLAYLGKSENLEWIAQNDFNAAATFIRIIFINE